MISENFFEKEDALPMEEDSSSEEKSVDEKAPPSKDEVEIFRLMPFGPTKPCFPPETQALLFLDFDGVLHREEFHALEFEFLPDFERALIDFPEVAIVISSTWRMTDPLERLRGRFSEGFRERVVGVTPIRKESTGDGERGREIRDFIVLNDLEGIPWLAVDDDARIFEEEVLSNVILTDGAFGLTEIDLRRLRVRLAELLGRESEDRLKISPSSGLL